MVDCEKYEFDNIDQSVDDQIIEVIAALEKFKTSVIANSKKSAWHKEDDMNMIRLKWQRGYELYLKCSDNGTFELEYPVNEPSKWPTYHSDGVKSVAENIFKEKYDYMITRIKEHYKSKKRKINAQMINY